MWKDPIVEQVRAIRHEIEAENGDDFEKIFSSAMEIQKQYKARVVSRHQELTDEDMPHSLSRI